MKNIPFKIANPDVEEKAIQLLEEQFYFQMPQDMKLFYLKHNGGVLLR